MTITQLTTTNPPQAQSACYEKPDFSHQDISRYFQKSDCINLEVHDYQNETFKLSFSCLPDVGHYFVWLRGIIALGNHFKIKTEVETQSFHLYLPEYQVCAFLKYLDRIQAELKKDIQFRAGLKLLLDINRKHEKLYNAILKDCCKGN